MKRLIVAVDGPAGSGKSSVSKKVASLLDLKYIDSGAIYRSVTYFILKHYGEIPRNLDFETIKDKIEIDQSFSKGTAVTYLNGIDVSSDIRDASVAANIGMVSDNPQVREFVNSMLRKWAEHGSIIMDGRDIGSVVFPDADLKIYLDASVEIRAERRAGEYRAMGKYLDENDIKRQIILRDEQDKNRSFGALVRADDSIYIDTSAMTQAEVVESIKGLILNPYSANK